MRTLVLDLPLPPRECHPNARRGGHWARKRDAIKAARQMAFAMAYSKMTGEPFKAATIESTFYTAQQGDSQNLIGWLKAYCDGFQDAKVVVNDRAFTFAPPIQFYGKASEGQRKVIVRIVETELP